MRKWIVRLLDLLSSSQLFLWSRAALSGRLRSFPASIRIRRSSWRKRGCRWLLEHARIYTLPTDPPIDDGTVLIRDGLICGGRDRVVPVPADATVLPCEHCVVTAGFWNAHVHFTEPKWNLAQWKADDLLNAQLADMLLSHGFTTVVDVGSNPADTFAMRRRIEHLQLRRHRTSTLRVRRCIRPTAFPSM